jgi:hypothetical protein
MSVTTTTYTTSSTSYIPQYQRLNVITFGNYLNATGYVTGDQVYFGSQPNPAAAAGTITFSTGSAPSGVYQGYGSSPWAPSPTSNNTASASITNDFIAAQAGSNINFAFNQTEQYFGALWGSMNATNELQFYNNGTLVATVQVVTKGGSHCRQHAGFLNPGDLGRYLLCLRQYRRRLQLRYCVLHLRCIRDGVCILCQLHHYGEPAHRHRR